MSKPLCIYHDNCADGITAAFIVQEATGAECIPGVYQKDPPLDLVKGRDVIVVDFSYKRPVMEELIPLVRSFVWLDHHDTAIKDMEGFPWPEGTIVVTDQARSGAGIAWDYYNPTIPRPWFVKYVEDRDLWKFKYLNTRAFNMGLFSFPLTLETISRYFIEPDLLVERGLHILQYNDNQVHLAVERAALLLMASCNVPATNVLPNIASDTGHALLEKFPNAKFAVTWYWDGKDGMFHYSLRGADRGVHVGEIAKEYGGGGHRDSAGFAIPYRLTMTPILPFEE